MEIVIDISEELYDSIQYELHLDKVLEQNDIRTLLLAVDGGVVIPKGHGDLVDISPYKGKVVCLHLYSGVKKLIEVDNIKPIIKADRKE